MRKCVSNILVKTKFITYFSHSLLLWQIRNKLFIHNYLLFGFTNSAEYLIIILQCLLPSLIITTCS